MKTIIPVLLVASLAMGCAPTKITTTSSIDPFTKQEVITTTEEPMESSSFFASDNLAVYYEYETKKLDTHAEVVDKKISAIKDNAIARAAIEMTNTERLLTNIIDSLLIDRIPTQAAPAGPPPKTMTDFFDKNFLGIANLGLQAYGIFLHDNSAGDDASVKISNTGAGDVFYQSSGNKNPLYNLAEGSVGTFDLSLSNLPTHDYSTSVSTTNDSSSETSKLW